MKIPRTISSQLILQKCETHLIMLNQELCFYSLDPSVYEQYLKDNGFKILLRESDQDKHLVWIARKEN